MYNKDMGRYTVAKLRPIYIHVGLEIKDIISKGFLIIRCKKLLTDLELIFAGHFFNWSNLCGAKTFCLRVLCKISVTFTAKVFNLDS